MSNGETRFVDRSLIIIPIITFLLHAVFLFGLGAWLWSREHYQFFPLVLVGSAVLAWYRMGDAVQGYSPKITFRVAAFGGFAILCFVIATVFESNWFGVLAAILSGWALIWACGGSVIAERLRGPVFLLLLGIPLPLNFDLRLIIKLQKIASLQASRLLDLYGVRHNVSGVAISRVDRGFMVEEACSGIHSLFSCVCVIVFLSVIQRYGLVRIFLNVVQAVIWVVVANVLRVFLVVYSHSVWQVSLESGWRHEALGVMTYLIALLMALSTDRLLQFIVPHVRPSTHRKEGEYEVSANPVSQIFAFLDDQRIRLNKFLDRPRLSESASMKVLVWILILVFMPLSAVSYGRVIGRRFSSPTVVTATEQVALGDIGELIARAGKMPPDIDGWHLVKTERLDRSPDDPFGMSSLIHMYQGHGLQVSFSVDGYYDAWHDLAYCYTGLDWKLKDQANSQDETTKYFSTRLNLYADDGQHLLNYFSCFDNDMNPVRPGAGTIGTIKTFENLLERLGIRPSQAGDDLPVTPPVFQLHLMCVSPQELLDHEKENVKRLFDRLSQETLTSLRETTR